MDTFKIDWPAVEAAMADLDNTAVTDEWAALSKRYRDLLAVRDKARMARKAEEHRASIRALDPNTPLTYRGYDRMFQGKEILLEKCNPKYVIVQIKGMPGKRNGNARPEWSRWNLNYSDLKIGPLDEFERSNRFINNTMQKLLTR